MHTLNQQEIFTNDATVKIFEDALKTEAARFGCEPLVYIFMPDHCHVVLRGKTCQAQPFNAMKSFTEVTRHWLSQFRPDIHWSELGPSQILADDEELAIHLQRILTNPVRKGIVKDWRDYKFKGSAIFDLENWLYPI